MEQKIQGEIACWKDLEVSRAIAQLGSTVQDRRVIGNVLEELQAKLEEAAKFDLYNPRRYLTMPLKADYTLRGRTVERSVKGSTAQLLPDSSILLFNDFGTVVICREDKGSWSQETLFKPLRNCVRIRMLPDQTVLTLNSDSVQLWGKSHPQSGWRCMREVQIPSVRCLEIFPSGEVLLAEGQGSGDVFLLSKVLSGRITESLFTHSCGVKDLQLMPDGRVISYGVDGMVQTFRYEGPELVPLIEFRASSLSNQICGLPGGAVLTAGARSFDISSFNSDMELKVESIEGLMSVPRCLRRFADGRIIAAFGPIAQIWKREPSGVWESQTLGDPESSGFIIRDIFCADDGRIFLHRDDLTLEVWDGDPVK